VGKRIFKGTAKTIMGGASNDHSFMVIRDVQTVCIERATEMVDGISNRPTFDHARLPSWDRRARIASLSAGGSWLICSCVRRRT
jgi:hypothetical protein